MLKYSYASVIILLALTLSPWSIAAQGTQIEFGKNRVQYHDDFSEWFKYESDNFITYWYGEGRNIGQAAVQIAEYEFARIQTVLEHRINDKLQIIVYTDISDLKQSNIGVEDAFTNTSDDTKVVGSTIFVYFNGNHNHLRRQLREGIASVYLDAMLFGSNLQEIVQNAVMMNLPPWFKEGLVGYAGENWSTELDDRLRDFVLSEEFEGFEDLATIDPELAGHSLWYFIGEHFGKPTVSNLLYLTRINRSVESGFLYVLGSSYEVVIDSWSRYFQQRYQGEVNSKSESALPLLEFKNKRNLPVTRVSLSPDGQQLLYVLNEIGRYKIYLHDLRTGDRKVIFKNGFRNAFQATDYNYPIVTWSPTGMEIAILYEKRDLPRLLLYDVATGKKTEESLSTEYHRVYSMDYASPFVLAFSATVGGYSDIFLYFIKTRQSQRITADFWDDLDATVAEIDGRRGILFASNRQDSLLQAARLDSIMPINTFDIFFYDLEEKSKELIRVTETPFANERNPVAVDTTYFAYRTDETGVYNRQVAYLEDFIHHFDQLITLTDGSEIIMHADSSLESLDSSLIDTIVIQPVIKTRAVPSYTSNFDRNLEMQATSPRAGRAAEVFVRDGRHQIRVGELALDTLVVPTPTRYRLNLGRALGLAPPELPERPTAMPPQVASPPIARPNNLEEVPDSLREDRDEYLFQSEFVEEATRRPSTAEEAGGESAPMRPEERNDDIALLRGVQPEMTQQYGQDQEVYRFRPGRIVPYRLEFHTDFVQTRLDNSLLFEGLEPYDANQDPFSYPPPGILFKANFKDLFEDYEFEGGVRIPTTFDGTEFFLVFNNRKKRLDKSFAVYRQNRRFTSNSQSIIPNVPDKRDVTSVLMQYGLRYPLDIFRSFRAYAQFRTDRNTQLATERPTLETPTETEQRIGLRLEYVFDNTMDVAMNIKNGSRYKIYANVVKKFDMQLFDGFSLDFNEGFMTILGVDARHYQRLLKHSVLAMRFSAATSFGSEKMLYFLGGTDGWLFPKTNEEIPFPSNAEDFAFKALAAPMRGFNINIRNGSNFALANAELRMPIFRYLFPNSRSSLLRNFQAVGFFDVGTAWEGRNPFSDDNPLNTTVINRSDQVEVKVNFFRDPVVAGYGVGARLLLFNYFIRVDYAWGIETKRVQDPILYFSLGTDF